jgi:hypothetical protein
MARTFDLQLTGGLHKIEVSSSRTAGRVRWTGAVHEAALHGKRRSTNTVVDRALHWHAAVVVVQACGGSLDMEQSGEDNS